MDCFGKENTWQWRKTPVCGAEVCNHQSQKKTNLAMKDPINPMMCATKACPRSLWTARGSPRRHWWKAGPPRGWMSAETGDRRPASFVPSHHAHAPPPGRETSKGTLPLRLSSLRPISFALTSPPHPLFHTAMPPQHRRQLADRPRWTSHGRQIRHHSSPCTSTRRCIPIHTHTLTCSNNSSNSNSSNNNSNNIRRRQSDLP